MCSRVSLPVLIRRTGAPTYLERRLALSRLCVCLAPGFREDLDRELLAAMMFSRSRKVRARAADELIVLICDRLLQLVGEHHSMRPSQFRDDWLDEKVAELFVAFGELPATRVREVVGLRLDLVGGASRVEIDNLLAAPARRAAA